MTTNTALLIDLPSERASLEAALAAYLPSSTCEAEVVLLRRLAPYAPHEATQLIDEVGHARRLHCSGTSGSSAGRGCRKPFRLV